MPKKENITVVGTEIAVLTHRKDDYISLTDMAKFKNAEIPAVVISHWLSTRFSISFMELWEKMNNPDFNLTGFREVKMMAAGCKSG
jgi:Cys-tRNA synthase (O-phospho-L-seryl-tRNA:Cys-tRNA synthase)